MKIINTSIILFLFIFLTANGNAQLEIQVIPYKISNPGDNFAIETGMEYAKLVSLASGIRKDIVIYPHNKTEATLKSLSINTQRIITENDILTIGKMGSADYILIGTLSKSKGNYTTSSVLYSIRDKRIMSKSHYKSGNLFKLAEEELNQIFFNFQNKKRSVNDSYADVVIVLDLSYKIAAEWESVKKGIINFADAVSDNWSVDTSINILPFSDKYSVQDKILNLNSNSALENKLKTIAPKGEKSTVNLKKILDYSIKEMPWRRKSDKILILISNSDAGESGFIDKYAISAKMQKISVNTISLGLLKDEGIEPLREFSKISSGRHYTAAYHQRFYNENGNPIDVFYQGGRIFHSLIYDSLWEEGLFENNNRSHSEWEKPKSFLNEIFYDKTKYNINPYNLSGYYHIISESRILNFAKIENNIESIMRRVGETFDYSSGKMKYKKPIAKAQVSDGKISVWIRIKEEEDLDFFSKNYASADYFPLGVIIKRNPNEPYGIAFYPDWFVTEFSNEYIPDIVKTNLSDILKNTDYYLSNGLFNPPFWFLNLKVERIEKYRREFDIRESQAP